MQPSIRQMNLDGLSRVGVVAFRDFVAQKCLGSLWYGSGKERKRRMECSPTSSLEEEESYKCTANSVELVPTRTMRLTKDD